MTAARLVALTLGELRSTSDTSDLDTPARAATVSRVGLRAVCDGGATCPYLWLAIGALQRYGKSVPRVQSRRTASVCSPGSGTPRGGPELAPLNRYGIR